MGEGQQKERHRQRVSHRWHLERRSVGGVEARDKSRSAQAGDIGSRSGRLGSVKRRPWLDIYMNNDKRLMSTSALSTPSSHLCPRLALQILSHGVATMIETVEHAVEYP